MRNGISIFTDINNDNRENRKNELEKSLKNFTNNENYKNSIKCLIIVLFPQLLSILSDSETYEEFTEE